MQNCHYDRPEEEKQSPLKPNLLCRIEEIVSTPEDQMNYLDFSSIGTNNL
jgi:hypothetical protein